MESESDQFENKTQMLVPVIQRSVEFFTELVIFNFYDTLPFSLITLKIKVYLRTHGLYGISLPAVYSVVFSTRHIRYYNK